MLRWRTGHLWIKFKVHKHRNSKTNNWIGISCTSTHYFLITYSVLQNVVQQFKIIYFDTLFIYVLTFKFKRIFFIVDKLFITIIDIGPKAYVQMYRNYQNKHAFWKNCTINIFPLPPNFIFTVLYTCIARGRSKFLNLCSFPVVILYNKNMFKSSKGVLPLLISNAVLQVYPGIPKFKQTTLTGREIIIFGTPKHPTHPLYTVGDGRINWWSL